jgi:hypothetical protein
MAAAQNKSFQKIAPKIIRWHGGDVARKLRRVGFPIVAALSAARMIL